MPPAATFPPDDSQPSDGTTLVEVLEGYRNAGYVTDFSVETTSTVRCDSCASVLESIRLPMYSLRRLEGASDPADMVAVVATTCPVCGADGTLVMGYGPMASEEDGAVLHSLADQRGGQDLPPGASPDETPDDSTS